MPASFSEQAATLMCSMRSSRSVPALLFLRQPDDHGDMDALFVEELFAPQVADSMIRPQEDSA